LRNGQPKFTEQTTDLMPAIIGQPWPLTPNAAADSYTPATLNVFAQELRAASSNPDARLQWTVGAFYTKSRQVGYQWVVSPYWPTQIQQAYGQSVEQVFGQPLLPGNQSIYEKEPLSDEQQAGYGQITWAVAKHFALVAGARVARETDKYSIYINGPLNGPKATQFSGEQTATVVDPKYGINMQLDDNNLLYVSATKGDCIGASIRRFTTFRRATRRSPRSVTRTARPAPTPATPCGATSSAPRTGSSTVVCRPRSAPSTSAGPTSSRSCRCPPVRRASPQISARQPVRASICRSMR
jgi:hypothetical protein